MATVVRLGPVPPQLRRAARLGELERVFRTTVDLLEVSTLAELATALATPGLIGVAVDAAPPGNSPRRSPPRNPSQCFGLCGVNTATFGVRSTSCSTATGF